jgi:hypothetical protein
MRLTSKPLHRMVINYQQPDCHGIKSLAHHHHHHEISYASSVVCNAGFDFPVVTKLGWEYAPQESSCVKWHELSLCSWSFVSETSMYEYIMCNSGHEASFRWKIDVRVCVIRYYSS